jgi:hypothetical protein
MTVKSPTERMGHEMNTLIIPGYTAEASIYKSNFSYQQMATVGNTSLAIQPAAEHICKRLGRASWDAYSQGDYKKV